MVKFAFCQKAGLTFCRLPPNLATREGALDDTDRFIVGQKEIIIGFDAPFCVIGERINPTGRKLLAAEMAADDYSRVLADAVAQVEAGATMLDVNAGIPMADEPAILAKAIQLVQETADVPLAIDSSIVAALESGLAVYKGKALVNSVTGEERPFETVLPLVKKYGAAVVAISNDETGISEDPNVRFEVAKKIVERAADYGIPREDVVVDPLIMPVGAINLAGRSALDLIMRLRNELKSQHDMRRLEHILWSAKPAWYECGIFVDGGGGRYDLGDHEPASC